jgi:uncharacterized integral membrane protein
MFLLVIFAVQNAEPVPIKFLVWNSQGSLALLLFIAVALGGLVAYLSSAPGQIRRRRLINHLQRQIAELEAAHPELQPAAEAPDEAKEEPF